MRGDQLGGPSPADGPLCPWAGLDPSNDGYQLRAMLDLPSISNRCSLKGMDRRHELIILAHSMAAMPPGQLALRREQAIELLDELQELQGRHNALRDALFRLADAGP